MGEFVAHSRNMLIAEVMAWMESNRILIGWLGAASLTMVILGLVIVPILVVRMQPDYFLEDRDDKRSMKERHPAVRLSSVVLKNLAGGLLVVGGILLSLPLVPGQGLLTILIGLAVMDFPGKRNLEIWLIRRKPVGWTIAKLREKANRPPLVMP